jgi:hypothetical protein
MTIADALLAADADDVAQSANKKTLATDATTDQREQRTDGRLMKERLLMRSHAPLPVRFMAPRTSLPPSPKKTVP